jgi:hypothetical protein
LVASDENIKTARNENVGNVFIKKEQEISSGFRKNMQHDNSEHKTKTQMLKNNQERK